MLLQGNLGTDQMNTPQVFFIPSDLIKKSSIVHVVFVFVTNETYSHDNNNEQGRRMITH